MPLNAVSLCKLWYELLDLQMHHLTLPADCCRALQLPSMRHCSKVTSLALHEVARRAQSLLVLQEAGLSVQGASAAL